MISLKSLLQILVIISPSIVRSQPGSKSGPGDTGGTTTTLAPKVLCDINGGDSTYNETIDGELRLITATGCPNHYSECTGKGGVCVEDETEAAFLDKSINIPAYPCFNNYTDDSEYNWAGYPVYCLLNNLGIALNGVSFFSPSANTECKDAIGQESESFDTCGGHAGPGGGYHYHAGPACLLDQLGDAQDSVQGHSPQIGWAYDGFPVYGPHGQDGEYILLCTQNNSNSSDCLDNCSGHRHHTIDGFKYHYHVAGPVGDLETSPLYPVPTNDRWPYTFGCFRGIPSDWSQTAERGTPELTCVESGVTDDYVAQPVDGVTDVYYYPAQDIETRTVYPSRSPSADTDITPSTTYATPTDITPSTTTVSDTDTTSTPTPSPVSNEEQVQVTGWVYTDNSFELYFNGEKIADGEDNAVYVNFTAPVEGLYAFTFLAQDNSNDSTGLELSNDGTGNWCMGDGGIIMQLSDGTVTASDWRCKVVMEGPLESECQTECAATPSQCTVQNNAYPSCWNEISCPDATYWSSAIEYTTDDIDWNVPSDMDWGDAVPIWTSDLDLDNTIICRYKYEKVIASSPETTYDGSDTTMTTTDNGANELIGFYAFIIAFISITMI